MRQTAVALMSEADYIQHELKGECRHEYINGQLFEMPGEKDVNNSIALFIAMLLYQNLPENLKIYTHDIKVAIPGGKKYRYPDLFVTAEKNQTQNDSYIKRKPVLIVEVVSKDSHKTDYVDKLIEYTKIPSLKYYLIIEPEMVQVTVCERDGEDWVSSQFVNTDDTIQLSLLNAALPLTAIYKDINR